MHPHTEQSPDDHAICGGRKPAPCCRGCDLGIGWLGDRLDGPWLAALDSCLSGRALDAYMATP
ncbi:MAG: hypothetical protein Q4G25_11260, partial [Paracoccus sp. (in: a-proteobacteria)]|nr:hypothetical protein [Paracoccus sp. (in: a-proteobacteria)]